MKNAPNRHNPFKPGYGQSPPYLAGREAAQEVFNERLRQMKDGETVNGIAMYGPRGAGKTALLSWLEGRCKAENIKALHATPDDSLQSRGDLADALFHGKLTFSEAGLVAGIGRWMQAASKFARTKVHSMAAMKRRLLSVSKKKPTVLLLDEAHRVTAANKDLYGALLDVCQKVAAEAPFLLTLCGTPSLPTRIRATESSFIGRADRIGIGCLGPDAAAAAIRIPLRNAGMTIREDALRAAVDDSQRYAYFLQLWGKALYDEAWRRGATEVSQEDVRGAFPEAQRGKTVNYSERYAEIRKSEDSGLAAAALAIADIFTAGGGDGRTIAEKQALAAIKNSLGPSIPPGEASARTETLLDELIRLDFIWVDPARASDLTAGIPSLMDYTRAQSGV